MAAAARYLLPRLVLSREAPGRRWHFAPPLSLYFFLAMVVALLAVSDSPRHPLSKSHQLAHRTTMTIKTTTGV
jgi:hypothetical protein